jgi:hypothetical protein
MKPSKIQLKVVQAEIVKYGIMCQIEALERSQKPVRKKGKN